MFANASDFVYNNLLRHSNFRHEGTFPETAKKLEEEIKALRAEAKTAVNSAAKRDKKSVQAQYDGQIAEKEEILTIAKEACWLYEKFGEGEYADVPGLCKLADRTEIESKGWSLTPGAYVGVAPIADDGVDFHERMKEIHEELQKLQAESNVLMATITRNMKELGI